MSRTALVGSIIRIMRYMVFGAIGIYRLSTFIRRPAQACGYRYISAVDVYQTSRAGVRLSVYGIRYSVRSVYIYQLSTFIRRSGPRRSWRYDLALWAGVMVVIVRQRPLKVGVDAHSTEHWHWHPVVREECKSDSRQNGLSNWGWVIFTCCHRFV